MMDDKRKIILVINDAEWEDIYTGVGLLEENYRGSLLDLKRGQKTRWCGSVEGSKIGIQRTYNLKRRIMNACVRRARKEKSHA